MKKASRFMPKYKSKKASKVTLFSFLTAVLALLIYLPMYFLALVGLGILTIIWGTIEQPKIDRHFQRLCNSRKGLSICEFAQEFDRKIVDTWIIRAVYEQLQAALPTKQLVPIQASDELFNTLKLDEDDLDLDLIEEIAQRTGRTLEDYQSNPYYGKVTTARNLVLFFNYQARGEAT
ncbi:hypothetical protein BTJ40_17865 [Microbulbifer sp. A4B17]|uniref:hypothetical protein n=1 Tax=Microbulbifer sp. A4B17 TaxID=359370 RepID=UPI000D52E1C1|nr:hypothetical protein [Microbulbifer sp. A4B17]AWF82523.1 hypothetical protein BTJ40_17865 [Microbulbifer sp. A4B17]